VTLDPAVPGVLYIKAPTRSRSKDRNRASGFGAFAHQARLARKRKEDSIKWARKIAARLRKDQLRRLPVEGRLAGSRAHPGSDASVDGVEDSPRYSQPEIDALGKRGLAFRRRNGTYAWPCADRRDLLNCLAEWNPSVHDALDVKAFLKRRVILMALEDLLPASCKLKIPASVK
jgi:hypothetical protein